MVFTVKLRGAGRKIGMQEDETLVWWVDLGFGAQNSTGPICFQCLKELLHAALSISSVPPNFSVIPNMSKPIYILNKNFIR